MTEAKRPNLMKAIVLVAAIAVATAVSAPFARTADAELVPGEAALSAQSGQAGDSVQYVEWARLYGDTALDTMAAVVQAGWQQSETAVIATSDGYWDALAASALAGANGAPVLFTDKDALSSQTRSELERLGAKRAFIVGGTAAVSAQVESQLQSLGLQVERLWGEKATSTAVAIAGAVGGARSDTCVIATSDGYWDALSASPYAYASRSPIYLTGAGNVLDAEALSAIGSCGYSRAVIAGGTAAVGGEVEAQLASCGIADVTRCWGQTAYVTSAELASWEASQGMSWSRLGIATGGGYWDALAGGALCGRDNAVLMLADGNGAFFPAGSKAAENRRAMGSARVFGGPAAVDGYTYSYLQETTKSCTATVTHGGEWGHWEYACVQEAWDEPVCEVRVICNACGADITGNVSYHLTETCPGGGSGSGYHSVDTQIGTVHHDAVYEDCWIKDKDDFLV